MREMTSEEYGQYVGQVNDANTLPALKKLNHELSEQFGTEGKDVDALLKLIAIKRQEIFDQP